MTISRPYRVGGLRWRRACAATLSALIAFCYADGASAAPYVPADDEQILERLPVRKGPEWDEIDRLQKALAVSPSDASVAAELARRYLDLFRAEGDPRLVAYATTALAPWTGDDVPTEIALERALVAQTEHRFAAADADLERLLARAPRTHEAWLIAASMALTRGDYEKSRRACSRLLLLEDATVTGACIAAVRAMTGQARDAYEFLRGRLAEQGDELDARLALWLETLAAETAVGLGRAQDADAHFQAALAEARDAHARPSIYLLAAYADFLLDENRPEKVLTLLAEAPAADALLLRIALAKRRLGRPYGADVETLRYRLQLSLDAYEDTHAREAAYLALHLLDEPTRALELALHNWQAQREPLDARLVLEAAVAAKQPRAAAPVTEWLAANAVEHVALNGLQARLGRRQ